MLTKTEQNPYNYTAFLVKKLKNLFGYFIDPAFSKSQFRDIVILRQTCPIMSKHD